MRGPPAGAGDPGYALSHERGVDVRTDGSYGADEVVAEDERELGLAGVAVAAHALLGEGHAGGEQLDERLASGGDRHRPVVDDEAVGLDDAGGTAALSLNGIAKAMGMSGPALYRYFSSRDELMATLVTESYEDLADTVDAAAEQARARSPEQRVRAALDAVRDWALKAPHRYRLVFGSTYGSGELDPERIIPTAHRPMSAVRGALSDIDTGSGQDTVNDSALRHQLTGWPESTNEPPYDPGLLLLGLTAWTRMHGILSLEIEGIFTQMGIDPERLYQAEINQLIAERTGRR